METSTLPEVQDAEWMAQVRSIQQALAIAQETINAVRQATPERELGRQAALFTIDRKLSEAVYSASGLTHNSHPDDLHP